MNIIVILFLITIAVALIGALLAYYNGKSVARAEIEAVIDWTDYPDEVRRMLARGKRLMEDHNDKVVDE